MKCFAVLSLPLILGSTLAFIPGPTTPTKEKRITYVIVTTEATVCECVATTGSATGHNDTTIECPGGTAGSIFVSTPSKTNGPCLEVGEVGCATEAGSKCKAKVTADLMWPSPASCCASAAATGPQIGTDQNPCQVATHGGVVPQQSWNLVATCEMGTTNTTSPPATPFQVFCGVACPIPAGTTPTADFAPVLSCSPCRRVVTE